jgi:hypothetical protein
MICNIRSLSKSLEELNNPTSLRRRLAIVLRQVLGPTIMGGAKILTQGEITSEYGNIQCTINFEISMGDQI